MESKQPRWQQLININLGFWGVQISNGLQTANISAVFETLGADASQLPLLWLGAPLMGLIAQPVVGQLSDRTWNFWGRRQPYFLVGAGLGTVIMLVLPWITHLWQAVAMYWALQLGLNIYVAPARSFIGDLLPPMYRTLGYSVQGFCIGLGAIAAAVLPWTLDRLLPFEPSVDGIIPWSISGSYVIGAVLLLVSTLWTFWAVNEPSPEALEREKPTESSEESNEQEESQLSIGRAIATMPPIMRQLAKVQVLTWIGIYCIFLYLPTAVAINILGASDRQSTNYIHGIEWAGICIAFYNLVCLGTSLLIPKLSRRWGRVITHAGCLMCGAIGLISLLLVHSKYPILLCMIGLGIAWASILSIPYALLMDELSASNSGIYMGLFNGFIALPQIVMSLGFGWVMETVLQENRLWALVLGGVFLGSAALATLLVSETEPQDLGDRQVSIPATRA